MQGVSLQSARYTTSINSQPGAVAGYTLGDRNRIPDGCIPKRKHHQGALLGACPAGWLVGWATGANEMCGCLLTQQTGSIHAMVMVPEGRKDERNRYNTHGAQSEQATV